MTEALSVRLLLQGLLICITVAAQTQDVQISGRVIDPSGAAVSKACVTLKGAGPTNKAAMFTNFNGEFVFSGLAPGTYDLSFTWRFRSGDLGGLKPRSLTVKADNKANVLPQVVMEVSEPPDYDYDALREYQSKFLFGSVELHNRCTFDLGAASAACPSTLKELAASKRKAHYLRLEADGEKLFLVR